MKTKRFDCVDMMHRGAKRIYRAAKNLSHSEELEFWRQKAAQLLGSRTRAPSNGGATREQLRET